MREERQFHSIIEVIKSYRNQRPLHLFLQHYFREHKQMGSNDRRLFNTWIYNYYRLGKALRNESVETRLAISNFLLQNNSSPLGQYALNNFANSIAADFNKSFEEKLIIIQQHFSFQLNDVFPFKELVSEDLSIEQFTLSLFHQPKVWIRIRKEFSDLVEQEFLNKNISFQKDTDHSLAWSVEQRTQLNELKSFHSGYFEIQDFNSQRTGDFFKPNADEQWLDCCAASGGKSLLLHSIEPGIHLTVCDNRSSVLKNLQVRFNRAGIKKYNSIVGDLTNEIPAEWRDKKFDGIILDAPCTGSGTWARTPEQIYFFDLQRIFYFRELQRSILKNIAPLLKKGKLLIYITCSVFKEENEEQINFAKQNGLKIENIVLLKGYNHEADSMFVARMIKA